jgi:uncharacterized membrane protein
LSGERIPKPDETPVTSRPRGAKAVPSAAATPPGASRWALLALLLMMLAYSAVFITVSLVKYACFLYNDFDMAIYTQAAFTTVRGSLHSSILGLNYLGNHVSLLMFLISPIYALLPSPATLLVLQTLVLAAGAIPVFRLARRELKNDFVAVCFAALYLLYPALGYSNLYEFHPETLTTTTLLFAFYYMWVGRLGPMVLFAVLSLMGKEDVALVVMTMGFYSLLIRRPRRWVFATVLAGLSAVFLVVSFGYLIPTLNKGEVYFQSRYEEWGATTGEALFNMVKSPLRVLRGLLAEETPAVFGLKLQYYVHVLLPVMLLSLLSPLTLAMAIPAVAQHLLTNWPAEHTIVFHYTACVTPFVLASAVLGAARLLRFKSRRLPGGFTAEGMNSKTRVRTLGYAVAAGAVGVSTACNLLFGPLIGSRVYQTHSASEKTRPSGEDRAMAPYMREMLARVKPDWPVASDFRFMPRLSSRKDVYSLHHVYKGSYTLTDKPYPLPDNVFATLVDTGDRRYLSFRRRDGGERLRELFRLNRLEAADAAGDAVLLLREPAEPISLYETGDFLPTQAVRTDLDGQLAFLGIDRVPPSVAVGGRLPIRTYWKRTGSANPDRYPFYHTFFFLKDSSGHGVFAHGRQICYTFYPVHDWPPNANVRENYNLVIPLDVGAGQYTLCLRVVAEEAKFSLLGSVIELAEIEVVPRAR